MQLAHSGEAALWCIDKAVETARYFSSRCTIEYYPKILVIAVNWLSGYRKMVVIAVNWLSGYRKMVVTAVETIFGLSENGCDCGRNHFRVTGKWL